MKRSRIWQSEWDVLRLGKRHAALYFNRKSKRSIAHHRSGEEYVRVQETIAVVLPVSPVPPGAYSRRCEAEGVLHLREHRVFVCRRAEIITMVLSHNTRPSRNNPLQGAYRCMT